MSISGTERKETIEEKHWVITALVRDGKIQLEKRIEVGTDFFGYIIVPGGSIESDETQEKAHEREIMEEYGVVALNSKKMDVVYDMDPINGVLYFMHVF
jgi:8-oxo-dGTP pyrophosphatase MutT (NUDIX family)